MNEQELIENWEEKQESKLLLSLLLSSLLAAFRIERPNWIDLKVTPLPMPQNLLLEYKYKGDDEQEMNEQELIKKWEEKHESRLFWDEMLSLKPIVPRMIASVFTSVKPLSAPIRGLTFEYVYK